MAAENDTNSNTDAAVTDVPATTPALKKQRAPRRPKATTDVMGGVTVAKLPRGRRKRSELAADATLTSTEPAVAGKRGAKSVVKVDGRKRRAKRAEAPVTAPVITAMDEMADLIQLEEENKRLRKTLAEKLRAENADLRKRLGLG
jgi:putative transposase